MSWQCLRMVCTATSNFLTNKSRQQLRFEASNLFLDVCCFEANMGKQFSLLYVLQKLMFILLKMPSGMKIKGFRTIFSCIVQKLRSLISAAVAPRISNQQRNQYTLDDMGSKLANMQIKKKHQH